MPRLHVLPALILFAAITAPAAALAAQDGFTAEPCGYGGGGRFTTLAIDPHDNQTILAGSDVAGIFKSTDGGGRFVLKGSGLEAFAVTDIVFHPDDARRVFALTDDGLYESADRGESWRRISARVAYRARFSGSSALVFFSGRLWAGTDEHGVFRIDLSAPEPVIEAVPGILTARVNGLAVFSQGLYAATSRGVYRYADGRMRSMNTGLAPGARNISDICVHGSDSLYLSEKSSGLYAWNGSRGRWEAPGMRMRTALPHAPKSYKALAVHPADPGTVVLATHPEDWPFLLLMSSDRGASWSAAGGFSFVPGSPVGWRSPVDAIESIVWDPANPSRLFMTDWWNIWRSLDGGRSWKQLTQGLQNTVVYDLKAHPQKPGTLFMAAADNGLLVSHDRGANWSRIMSGVPDGHALEVEISRQNPDKMYLLALPWNGGGRVHVYRTLDGGARWQDAGFPLAQGAAHALGHVDGLPTNLELDPVSDDTVYVGINGHGVFKTADGGRTWGAVNKGLAAPYIKGPGALLVHPKRPRTLFASTQSGGVYKTVDGGGSWAAVTRGDWFTFGMALDPADPSRIIVCCAGKKVIVSADEGLTWRETQLPGAAPEHIAAYAAAFDPARPGRVVVGTLAYDCKAADGLFVSGNGGRTFEPVPLDLPRVSINDILISTEDRSGIYVGFNGIGPFRLVEQ